jgi:hypothetical protein
MQEERGVADVPARAGRRGWLWVEGVVPKVARYEVYSNQEVWQPLNYTLPKKMLTDCFFMFSMLVCNRSKEVNLHTRRFHYRGHSTMQVT